MYIYSSHTIYNYLYVYKRIINLLLLILLIPVVYCDYTATGRSLQFLEDYIVKEVLPYLGDTRASTSICSLQSSLFRYDGDVVYV